MRAETTMRAQSNKNKQKNGANNPANHKDDGRVLRIVHEKCSSDCARQLAARQKAQHCDRNLLQEQREQRADNSQEERNCQRQERGWILDQMRRKLHSRRKSDRGDAQPEQFASKNKITTPIRMLKIGMEKFIDGKRI